MSFDSERFVSAQFTARTKAVSVPALEEFFDEEPHEWIVRGISSNELHRAHIAESTQKDVSKIIQAITSTGDQAKEIRKAIGMGDGTPGEIAKRLQMLVAGSVSPEITMPVAAKLAENFPIEFLQLTNEITLLTGQGAEMVKPEAASSPITA